MGARARNRAHQPFFFEDRLGASLKKSFGSNGAMIGRSLLSNVQMPTKYAGAMPKETQVNTHLGLTIAVSATLAASAVWAQEAPVHRHYHHHYHYHHHNIVHPAPAPLAERPSQAVENASPQANQMFKPYAQPGEGDDDGLSRDPDDCMKGCIGGNPQ